MNTPIREDNELKSLVVSESLNQRYARLAEYLEIYHDVVEIMWRMTEDGAYTVEGVFNDLRSLAEKLQDWTDGELLPGVDCDKHTADGGTL